MSNPWEHAQRKFSPTETMLPAHVQRDEDAALGAAWRRCEVALPDGWVMEIVRWKAIAPELNPQTGYQIRRVNHYLAGAQRVFTAMNDKLQFDANTATEALTALAETLEERNAG